MAKVKISDVSINYELKGKVGSKNKVAFFNGGQSSISSWDIYIPAFEKMGYEVLLHDFRGQLLSEKPKGPFTFHQHALDFKALIDNLGIEKTHVISTSYGGMVAMRFAAEFSDSIQSLSLIDTTSEKDKSLEYHTQNLQNSAKKRDLKNILEMITPIIYGNDFLDKHIEYINQKRNSTANIPDDFFDGLINITDAMINDIYFTDELHKIKCPTMVVCGENDYLIPLKFSRILAKNISNSEFVILPDCGHAAIIEQANTLISLLLGFIIKNS